MPNLEKLPIAAIIPILNCADRLAIHLEDALLWLPHVAQIIVVDSFSEDGSLEVVEKIIGHLDYQVLQHPKGLYQSWNAGVAEARTDYIYFSTVGDNITLKGMRQLVESAQLLRADVVISPPLFVYEDQSLIQRDTTWPIHDIIEDLNIVEPQLMAQSVAYDYVLLYLERAILGSSASNLYRRRTLSAFPFSADYFSAGDSAWIVHHNFDVRIGIDPRVRATYLYHEKDWSFDADESERGQLLRKRLAYQAFNTFLERSKGLDPLIKEKAYVFIQQVFGDDPYDTAEIHLGPISDLANYLSTRHHVSLNDFFYLDLMMTRVGYLRAREVERRFKINFSFFRHMFPQALANRYRRKKLKSGLMQLIQDYRQHKAIDHSQKIGYAHLDAHQ